MHISAELTVRSVHDQEHNATVLCKNYVQCMVSNVVEIITIIFVIIYVAIHIGRLLHVFFRLCLSASVHPTLDDVLPSTSCELDYPFVAIQLPMMNETECCESAIECACNLDWPKSRLFIQVLDDSTDEQTIAVINKCVEEWQKGGVQIHVYRREDRHGFKAGNLVHGMSFIRHAEYIAIFDVDFLPTKDYLSRTVPVLIHDPTVAFVQARWTFTNPKESFLTRMQEIALNFHHKCEQEGRSRTSLFFTFNGSGGIWRTSAIEEAGGWHTDTVVEDLDLSLRAHLNGWRSVYMQDVECLNELPPTLSAYLSQQHRWISGPMQVAQKLIKRVYQTKDISYSKKFFCLWFLFRYFIHIFHAISLVVTIPMSIWVPQTFIYNLVSICVSIISTLSITVFTPDEIHRTLLYVLFLNAMAVHNACAIISGLLNYNSAREWVVTPKFGRGTNDNWKKENPGESYHYCSSFNVYWINDFVQSTYQWVTQKFRSFRFYKRNFFVAIYLLVISYLAFKNGKYVISIYIFCTGIMYFIFALGYIGQFE